MANDTENYKGHEIKVKQVDGKISPLWYAWVDGSKIKASQCTAEDALKYAKASIDSHESRKAAPVPTGTPGRQFVSSSIAPEKLDKALGTQEDIDDLLKGF
jgi:hypothetical protein